VPDVDIAPVQPPVAVQLEALVLLQVKVTVEPDATKPGKAERDTVGAGAGAGAGAGPEPPLPPPQAASAPGRINQNRNLIVLLPYIRVGVRTYAPSLRYSLECTTAPGS
jgi:hypothetical protein